MPATGKPQLLSAGIKPENIRIDFKKRKARMTLCVVDFIDGDHYVTYIPSLKLTGYGQTKEEAIEMLFEDVLDDMFEELMKLSPEEVLRELQKFGWKKHRLFHKQFTNTPYVDKDGILRDFNLPEATRVNAGYVTTAAAA